MRLVIESVYTVGSASLDSSGLEKTRVSNFQSINLFLWKLHHYWKSYHSWGQTSSSSLLLTQCLTLSHYYVSPRLHLRSRYPNITYLPDSISGPGQVSSGEKGPRRTSAASEAKGGHNGESASLGKCLFKPVDLLALSCLHRPPRLQVRFRPHLLLLYISPSLLEI